MVNELGSIQPHNVPFPAERDVPKDQLSGPARRAQFAQEEAMEMSQARHQLRREAQRWALRAIIPAALIGWALGPVLAPVFIQSNSEWSRPGALLSLLLGAMCGALGAALISLLCHSLFNEDQEIPIIVVGVTMLLATAGGLYGAGLGDFTGAFIGVALGAPLGLIGGVGVLIVYSAVTWVAAWIRKETGRF
jgi:hypothetical protein